MGAGIDLNGPRGSAAVYLLDQSLANLPADFAVRKARGHALLEERMKEQLDTASDDEVSISAVVEQARQTVANTLEECRSPEPGADPDAIQGRIVLAMRLYMLLDSIDNYRHDLDLLEVHHTMRTLRDRWDAGERSNRTYGRSRSDYFRNFCTRFVDDFRYLRQHERELRARLADPHGDAFFGSRIHEEIVDTAFDAALNMEVNFERVCFDIETLGLLPPK
jgi:hypothetical protein